MGDFFDELIDGYLNNPHCAFRNGMLCDEMCSLYNKEAKDCNINVGIRSLGDIASKMAAKYPHHVTMRPDGFTMHYVSEEELDGQDDMHEM